MSPLDKRRFWCIMWFGFVLMKRTASEKQRREVIDEGRGQEVGFMSELRSYPELALLYYPGVS